MLQLAVFHNSMLYSTYHKHNYTYYININTDALHPFMTKTLTVAGYGPFDTWSVLS